MRSNPSVIFTRPGKVEVQDRPMPTLAAGEVLIRTARSLISTGTEMTLLNGLGPRGSVWDRMSAYPYVAGYSNAGTVIAAGPRVPESLIGKRAGSHSPHAAYVACPADELRMIPDGVSDEDATFYSLVEVVMNSLRRASLTWGESVAVIGLGLIGQLTMRLCAVAGARTIFGVEVSRFRIGLVPRDEMFQPLEGEVEALVETIMSRNHGRLADVIFEATGKPEVIASELSLLRPQGRFIILSSPCGATQFDFHDLCNRHSFTIIGAHYFSHPQAGTLDNPWTAIRHSELFADYVLSNRIAVNDLITHRFSYEHAADAYKLLSEERDKALGVVFKWD